MQKLFDDFQVTKQYRSSFVEIIPVIPFSTFSVQQNSFNSMQHVPCFVSTWLIQILYYVNVKLCMPAYLNQTVILRKTFLDMHCISCYTWIGILRTNCTY